MVLRDPEGVHGKQFMRSRYLHYDKSQRKVPYMSTFARHEISELTKTQLIKLSDNTTLIKMETATS